jgi:predicted nicotinamide N-methyase
LTWGSYNEELFRFESLDLILGSDLFFDPEVFEPLVETVAYLLTQNPRAQVLIGRFRV